MTTYKYLIKPFGTETWIDKNEKLFNFYQTTLYNNKTESIKLLGKQILDCNLYGSPTSNKELFKYQLAVFYLGLYYYDKSNTFLVDMPYLNTVYNFDKLKLCIRKLGINEVNYEDVFTFIPEPSKVYYWQLNNPIDDINSILPLFNEVYLSNKPNSSYITFTQGKIVNYTNVGRVVFAVTETSGVDFEIKDSLGNDMTNEFTSEYYPSIRTILLVSKLPQSISNIYFRFKPL